ncbi:copper transpport protein [Cryptotrichosporon argae]
MPSTDAPARCSMNMLWNSQVADTCVVFRSWHIHGWMTLLVSCLAIIALSISYAFLLSFIRHYDRTLAYGVYADSRGAGRRESAVERRQSLIPPVPTGYSAVDAGAGKIGITKLPLQARVTRAGLYATSVAISFFLMLVAMTYNTYLISSIVIGAFIGHLLYESEIDVGALFGSSSKGLACH